jgi:uncharacterized protein YyaL (SSP411 family)
MTSHPHFDDRSGQRWHTRLQDAQSEAASAGKLIFVEFSRPTCRSCRSLFDELLPDPECATLLKDSFVCLAADTSRPEADLLEIGAQHMPYATMLPVCFYLTPDGEFLHGSTGRLDKQVFTADLRHALNQAQRLAEP